MKISQKRLKEVIVEEIEKLQAENSAPEAPAPKDKLDQILDKVAEWASKSWLFGTNDAELWADIERRARLRQASPMALGGAGKKGA